MNGQQPSNRPQKNGGSEPPKGPLRIRGLFGWMLVIGIAVMIAMVLRSIVPSALPLEISEFHDLVTDPGRRGEISRAWIDGDVAYCTRNGKDFYIQLTPDLIKQYADLMRVNLGTRFANKNRQSITKPNPFFQDMLLWMFVPLLLFGLLWFFFFRQMRSAGGPGGVLSFGRTRAKLASKEQAKITFDDVAGIEEAKEEVREIIEFLKDASKFERLGARIPRGVMLMGPPGTGKTLLAKAIAGEADVPFYIISGSDFVEMFVGVGASRVRDLFRQAKETSPCIIFLDEIDAVGRRRGMGYSGGNDEREQTLNAILVEMDGFDTNEQVILVAATNRPDILDPALRRPGRFDREVVLSLPDMKEREAILKVHAKKVKLAEGVDLMRVARGTPGFSGADLAAVINEGALAATMLDKDAVELADLEEARDKVRWGRAKRSRAMDEADRRISAHHEAGHALVSLLLQPNVEPLHKVSIIPRGTALGSTMFLPKKDRQLIMRKECLGNVKVSLAGRLAEEIFCGDISSGAANDIQQATELVRRMVMDWGMSDRIGPIRYGGSENGPDWWPGDMGGRKAYSEVTAREIDEEVKRILDQCFEETKLLVEQNKEQMALLAEALLKHEVLDAEEVEKVIKGEPIARDSGKEEKASGGEKVISEEQADARAPEAGTVAEDLAEGGTTDNPGGGAGAENPEGTA